MGKSFAEPDALDTARQVIDKAKEKNIKLYMPVDFVVADKFSASAETKVVTYQEIPTDWMALDIGPATVNPVRGGHTKRQDHHLERPHGGL